MSDWDIHNRVRDLFGEECHASIIVNESAKTAWIVVWRVLQNGPAELLAIGAGETLVEAWADVEQAD